MARDSGLWGTDESKGDDTATTPTISVGQSTGPGDKPVFQERNAAGSERAAGARTGNSLANTFGANTTEVSASTAVKTPGWHYGMRYTTSDNQVRIKTECLVATKGDTIQNAPRGGRFDASDFVE